MIALYLSLAACMGWGVADFLGGLKSRHLPTITVLAFSNIFGVAVISSMVYLRGSPLPVSPALLWAVAGGVAGIAAMFLLYKGLSVGSMSIVAPISATGVILPVILGVALGDRLTSFQLLGIVAAMMGSILVAREKDTTGHGRQLAGGVGYAAASAVAVGVFFYRYGPGERD